MFCYRNGLRSVHGLEGRVVEIAGGFGLTRVEVRSDQADDLPGRGGPRDGLDQSNRVERLVGGAAKRGAVQQGGHEVAVDRLAWSRVRGLVAEAPAASSTSRIWSVARSRPRSPK